MYPEAYAMIHQRFNVESIEELDASQIPQAVEYIHRVVLEGEFIGKQEENQRAFCKRSKQPCMAMGLCQPLTGIIPRTVSGAKTNSIELFRQMS